MKRWITAIKSIFIILILLSASMFFNSCSSQPGSASISPTFSISESTVERLKFSLLYPNQPTDWSKAWVWQDIMKKANVDIEVINNTGTDYNEKLSVLYASGQCPDVFSSSGLTEYEQNGSARFTIEDFKKYMPLSFKNTQIAMNELDVNVENTWKKYYTGDKLFGTPSVWYQGSFGHGPIWRQDLLAELGYSVPPDTIAGYEEVFARYKAKYPDRFAYGSNNDFARYWDLVFGSTGNPIVRWITKGPDMVPAWIQPGVRNALEVLARWYKLGYIDKEFITKTNLGDFSDFSNGITIVMEWCEYGQFAEMEKINDGGDPAETIFATLFELYPGAKLIAGPFPTMDSSVKPAVLCWHPFTGIACCFARKLEGDPDRLHAIMGALDYMSQTPELAIEAAFGIEGVTYQIVNNQVEYIGDYKDPQIRSAAGLAFGGWQCFQPFQLEEPFYPKYYKIASDKYFLNENSLYNSSRLTKWPRISLNIIDDQGNDLKLKYADLINERETLFPEIITGKKPITDFDKYIIRWNTSGGAELQKNCTRLYRAIYDAL